MGDSPGNSSTSSDSSHRSYDHDPASPLRSRQSRLKAAVLVFLEQSAQVERLYDDLKERQGTNQKQLETTIQLLRQVIEGAHELDQQLQGCTQETTLSLMTVKKLAEPIQKSAEKLQLLHEKREHCEPLYQAFASAAGQATQCLTGDLENDAGFFNIGSHVQSANGSWALSLAQRTGLTSIASLGFSDKRILTISKQFNPKKVFKDSEPNREVKKAAHQLEIELASDAYCVKTNEISTHEQLGAFNPTSSPFPKLWKKSAGQTIADFHLQQHYEGRIVAIRNMARAERGKVKHLPRLFPMPVGESQQPNHDDWLLSDKLNDRVKGVFWDFERKVPLTADQSSGGAAFAGTQQIAEPELLADYRDTMALCAYNKPEIYPSFMGLMRFADQKGYLDNDTVAADFFAIVARETKSVREGASYQEKCQEVLDRLNKDDAARQKLVERMGHLKSLHDEAARIEEPFAAYRSPYLASTMNTQADIYQTLRASLAQAETRKVEEARQRAEEMRRVSVHGAVALTVDEENQFDATPWDISQLSERKSLDVVAILTKAYEADYKAKKRALEKAKEETGKWSDREALHQKLLTKLGTLLKTRPYPSAQELNDTLNFLHAAKRTDDTVLNADPELKRLIDKANKLKAVKGDNGYWDAIISPLEDELTKANTIQSQKDAQAAEIQRLHNREAAYQSICDKISKLNQDTSDNFVATAEQLFPGLNKIWNESTEDKLVVNVTHWAHESNDELKKEREALVAERSRYPERQTLMLTEKSLGEAPASLVADPEQATRDAQQISQVFIDRYCAEKKAIYQQRAETRRKYFDGWGLALTNSKRQRQVQADQDARTKVEQRYLPNLANLAQDFCSSTKISEKLNQEWQKIKPAKYTVQELEHFWKTKSAQLNPINPNYYRDRMALAILCYHFRSEIMRGEEPTAHASVTNLCEQGIKYLQEHANQADQNSNKHAPNVQKVELMLQQLEKGNYAYLQQAASVNTGWGFSTDGKNIFRDKRGAEPLLVKQMKAAIDKYNAMPANAAKQILSHGDTKQAYDYLISRATAAAEILNATNEKVLKVNRLIEALNSGDAEKLANAAAIKTGYFGWLVDSTGSGHFPKSKK